MTTDNLPTSVETEVQSTRRPSTDRRSMHSAIDGRPDSVSRSKERSADEESTTGLAIPIPQIFSLPTEEVHEKRHRTIHFLPNWVKNELVAGMSEFIGTVLFLMFALGGCNVANVPADTSSSTAINVTSGTNVSILLYISLCFGFSLTVNAWVFFRISGGLFNPYGPFPSQTVLTIRAVSFALCLIGAITPLRMALLTLAQLLGGITAAAIVDSLSPGSLNVSVALSQGTSVTQGLFLEMFLTIMLVFTIIMLAAEKHKATFIAPVGIGLALFIAHLWGVNWTGCGANPARALGPAITNRSFEGYFWIYFAGPYLGGAVSAFFYWVNKKLKFEEVNPGQDDDPTTRAELNRVLDERLEEGNLIITGNNHR